MNNIKRLTFLLAIFMTQQAYGQDFGVYGHTFAIIEEDLQEVILKRLQKKSDTGELAKEQAKLQKRAIQSIERPEAVKGITKATKNRIFTYDPTIHVPYDLKDHQGRVFHPKGTTFNPLKVRNLTSTLVFIDGDDGAQVQWYLDNFKDKKTKLILVKGAPIELEKRLNAPVYFDQAGTLTTKLGIKAVPAVVMQKGAVLQIEELRITNAINSNKQ